MNEQQHCVVIGASHAGSQLALQLRKSGWQGPVTLLGAEASLPYHRPPLSKAVMAGDKTVSDILLRPATLYQSNDIELRLQTRVTGLLPAERKLRLDSGEELDYDRLALCTGSRVIRLPLGDGLAGVHYLRTIDDIHAIREDLTAARRAVIIGAGYIGLEAAAVLSRLGLEVTVLEREGRVLNRVTGDAVSRYIAGLHEANGVNIACNAEVVSINGRERVESVSCADGAQYPADLVIVGVGIVPETSLAEQAGLRIEDGIRVDEYACSSDPAIYAAGDCTSHPSRLYGRRVRLESVQNANDQSRVAAANICGAEQAYDALPWFWSDQFDIKLQAAGLSEGHDDTELLGEADPRGTAGFTLLYFRDGRLIAADCVNQAKRFMACRKLIEQRAEREEALRQLG